MSFFNTFFPDMPSSWSVSWYIYIFSTWTTLLALLWYLHCSGSAYSDCTEGARSSTLVVFKHLPVLSFFSKIVFSFFSLFLFPKIGDFLKCCPIFGVVTHKLWGYHRLNGFKITGMVYYNCSSLMILVNNENYICFDPFFQPPWVFPHCRYKPFIKSIICQQHNNWYHTTRISIYSINMFENLLKRFIYIYTL